MMHVAQLFFMKRSVRDALELESFRARVSNLLVPYVYFMMIKAFDTDMVDKWMSSWST